MAGNDDALLIVTFLWRDQNFKYRDKFQYEPQHVIALFRQLRKFLHIPFYFTVVCDDQMLPSMERWVASYNQLSGRRSDKRPGEMDKIDIYRLWDEEQSSGRCWRRLRGFSAFEFGQNQRVLFIDLDMMILDDITPIFQKFESDPFVIADDSICEGSKYNGSFILFTPTPTTHRMWSNFHADPEKCKHLLRTKGWIGTDQAWIRFYLDEIAHYPVKVIGADDGLLSFRWHCQDRKVDPFDAGARLVNFHGPFMPEMPAIQHDYPWTKIYNSYFD